MYEKFYNYLRNIILDTNKLSNKEIREICYEYYAYIPEFYHLRETPKIIITDIKNVINGKNKWDNWNYIEQWKQIDSIIDEYNVDKKIKIDFDILGIDLPISNQSCGILAENSYKYIYYIDFLNIPIPDNLRYFWNFYKRTLGLYSIIYDFYKDTIIVAKKPDKIFIQDNITYCRYGFKHFCDGIRVPMWLYYTNKKNLVPENYFKIKKEGTKWIFLKKIGLEKFINNGEIIDSYENYPGYKWWIKSEYKLIDMKGIFGGETLKSSDRKNLRKEYYNYAPFLCMKNQTTGEYHLEGVSPNCKDLYDAIEMRYKDLDLLKHEITNIK